MERNESMFIPALRMVAVALALSACGGANPAYPAVAHGTLDLHKSLPAPTPTPYEAYGARQPWFGKRATSDAEAAVAPYLRAQAPAPGRQVSSRPAQRTPRKPLPVSADRTALAVSRAASRAPSGPESVTTRVAGPDDARLLATKTESISADAERYARRQNRTLEGYRGGDAIVITASTVLIVLLIVLLVLLLT